MKAVVLSAMLSVLMLGACTGVAPFEDNSDKVKIKQRIPSK